MDVDVDVGGAVVLAGRSVRSTSTVSTSSIVSMLTGYCASVARSAGWSPHTNFSRLDVERAAVGLLDLVRDDVALVERRARSRSWPPPVWKYGPWSRSSRIESAAPMGRRPHWTRPPLLAATNSPAPITKPDEQHGDRGDDDELHVGVALTASAHERSVSPGRRCSRRSMSPPRTGRGRPTRTGGTNAATLPRRHRQARAWTDTIGAPRSSPGPCATPASRSSTPACSRRPSQVAEAALQEDADAVGLSLLSGAHMTLIPKIVDELRARDLDDVSCSRAASSRADDIADAQGRTASPAVFTPGSPLADDHRLARIGARLARAPVGAIASHPHPPFQENRWICSSTRASSCSPATASRCRPASVAETVDEAVAAAERVGYPVVVKAQVQVGGRGKAGGVKLAANADEVRTHAGQHPRPRHQGPRRARACGSSTRPTSPRSTTRRSRSTAPRSSTSACSSAQGGVEIETGRRGEPRRDRAHRRRSRRRA